MTPTLRDDLAADLGAVDRNAAYEPRMSSTTRNLLADRLIALGWTKGPQVSPARPEPIGYAWATHEWSSGVFRTAELARQVVGYWAGGGAQVCALVPVPEATR